MDTFCLDISVAGLVSSARLAEGGGAVTYGAGSAEAIVAFAVVSVRARRIGLRRFGGGLDVRCTAPVTIGSSFKEPYRCAP